MATLDTVAEQGNVPLNVLTQDIADEVERKTGTRPPIADVADAETIDPARLEELHAIVKDLHAGKTVEEVKPRFEELIQDVEATEIAAMEQKLIEGGVPDTEVKRLCDVHVQVFADALADHEPITRAGRPPAGHVPAREPGAAAGDRLAAQGGRGDRRAAGRRRVGAPQGRPERHGGAARRGRQALPAQGEPALPLPRGPRRGGSEQGDVVHPRRHPRPHQAGAADDRRATTRRWP